MATENTVTPIGVFWVKAIVRLDRLSWVAVQKLEATVFPKHRFPHRVCG